MQNFSARANRRALCRSRCCCRRNILKFERHNRHAACKLADRIKILVPGVDFHIRDLPRRSVFVGRKRVNPITHTLGRDGEHTTELPTSEHSDRATRQNRRTAVVAGHGKPSCRTDSACFRRNASNRVRISGYLFPRMLAASSAAFVAPALPIARVATGTPAGICTIDSSESTPWRTLLLIGTPKTGSVVFAATIPGK